MKNLFTSFFAVLAFVISPNLARADTILFPVITINPSNVASVVSVSNMATSTSPRLRYIYRHKSTLENNQPNLTGTCATYSFTNETYVNDLVSFDAGGTFDNGAALYGDTNTYTTRFNLPTTTLSRAYLLVTHADSAGNRTNVGDNNSLFGEVIMMDIANGAAWGYRGINDKSREDFNFRTNTQGGGVYYAMDNSTGSRPITLLPPNEWTTRIFVTPIGDNLDTANNTATISIEPTITARNGSTFTITPQNITVNCTGAFDAVDLLDSTTRAAIQNSGGTMKLRVNSGSAIMYKLEYTTNVTKYKGVINNGYLISTFEN